MFVYLNDTESSTKSASAAHHYRGDDGDAWCLARQLLHLLQMAINYMVNFFPTGIADGVTAADLLACECGDGHRRIFFSRS